MEFYNKIAKYYDDIFKPNEKQVSFLKSYFGNPPKSILDLACGTGNLALKLSQLGYNVTGLDLDKEMIEVAKSKINNEKIKFFVDNMLTFSFNEKFDGIYCIGNSLVHLNSINEIQKFFYNVKANLLKQGKIVIQIINYDRILKYNINQLPTIYNQEKDLTFIRNYQYDKKNHKIMFMTELKVNNLILKNVIGLYPLLSEELVNILLTEGFKDIKLYGDFAYNSYNKDESYSLVVSATH